MPAGQTGGDEKEEAMDRLSDYRYCAVNIGLVILQAAVFFLCAVTGDRLYLAGRCGTRLVLEQGEYWRLLTSVFLHADFAHIASNMFVQVFMGNAVERNLGHVRYLILYLLSGAGGNIISVLCDRAMGVNVYSVGASGAVFGVMGALIILIIKGRNTLRRGSSLLARAAFAAFYAVYSGFRTSYTDNAAHIGGLALGIVLGVLLTITMEELDLRDLR